VIINFGSHIALKERNCISLATGLAIALQKYPNLRVLWKLKRAHGLPLDENLTTSLGSAWDSGRVKIVEWFDISPAQLLMLPGVVASVHHGGANSYFETSR